MASSRGVDLFTPDNPDAPFFEIKIEDTIYDIDVNYIENLSVRRVMDDVGSFNFTLVNVMDLQLEYKFHDLFLAYSHSQPPISFRYGWSLGEKSKFYRGFLQTYNPEFMPGGYVRLSVNGVLQGATATTEMTLAYKAKSSTDLVEQIAQDLGWVVEDIDQSVPFSVERPFTISNIGVVDYIRKQIAPQTVNAKNEPFRFYSETQNGGQTHIWFVSVNKKIGTQRNYNFYINSGNYGSVLSWSPRYSGYTMAGFMQSAMVDPETNDVCVYGSEAKAASKEGAILTVYGSQTPDRMGAMLANKWYQTNIGSLSASLEIVGDPTLVPYQSVNVLPMMADGSLHRFTSGTYQIREITDNISGTYTTNLELFMIGEDDGTKTMSLVEAVKFKGSE